MRYLFFVPVISFVNVDVSLVYTLPTGIKEDIFKNALDKRQQPASPPPPPGSPPQQQDDIVSPIYTDMLIIEKAIAQPWTLLYPPPPQQDLGPQE
jgi:hypothetical protein